MRDTVYPGAQRALAVKAAEAAPQRNMNLLKEVPALIPTRAEARDYMDDGSAVLNLRLLRDVFPRSTHLRAA
jgi:hypothetical protein